jgi:hypothetical protein
MEILVPILILAAVLAAAYGGWRFIRASSGGGDADSTSAIPQQEPRFERPLGDTPEAHDEISPHDIPLDNPGRVKAEEMAGGEDGTTRGPLPDG